MPQTPGQRLDACLAPFLAQQQQLASELALQQEQLLAITRAMDATRQALEGLEVDMSHAVRRALQEDPSLRRVLGLQVEDVLGDDGSMGWLEGAGPQTSEPVTQATADTDSRNAVEATSTAPSDAGVAAFDEDDASEGEDQPTLPDNPQTSEAGESLGRLQTRVFPPPKRDEDELDLDCDFEAPEDILAEDDAETAATDDAFAPAETPSAESSPTETGLDETPTTDASNIAAHPDDNGDEDDTLAASDALPGDEFEDDFADALADLGDFEAPEPAEPIAAPETSETPSDEATETNQAVLAETTDAPSVTDVATANTDADAAAEPTESAVTEQIATSESIADSVEASSDPCNATAAATQTDAAPAAPQAEPESTAADGADAAIVEMQPEVVDVDNVVLDAPDGEDALVTAEDMANAESASEAALEAVPDSAQDPAEATSEPLEAASDEDNTEAAAPAASVADVENDAAGEQPATDAAEETAEEVEAAGVESATEDVAEPPVDDIDFSDPEALSQALDAAMVEGGLIDADMEEATEPAPSDDTPETAEPSSQSPATGPKGLAEMDPAEFDLDLPEDTPQQDAA